MSDPSLVSTARRSALFVDFDNIYFGLLRLDPLAAERFAREPLRWLHLLEVIQVPAAGRHLDFPLAPEEWRRATGLIGGEDARPIVGVHVGASAPERRPEPSDS